GRTALPLHLDTTQTQTFAAFTDRLRQALQTNGRAVTPLERSPQSTGCVARLLAEGRLGPAPPFTGVWVARRVDILFLLPGWPRASVSRMVGSPLIAGSAPRGC
ncbi:hypothetical protein ACWCXL_43115, partial [Streptomyces sp. NPDC001588]